VIRLTAKRTRDATVRVVLQTVLMAVSAWQMNRFERALFRAAVGLAGLIVVVRIGFVAIMWYLHHVR
jgi:hypothetical protein